MASRRGTELGDFLRTRRERIDPARAGLPGTPRRRVAGLRREELAHLAGVSADYYARLEQGRQQTASPAVLDAVSATLQLSAVERSHLYDLARVVDPDGSAGPKPGPGTGSALPSTVQRMFDALGSTPALALDHLCDVVAANRGARVLFPDFDAMPVHDRNTVVWMLVDPAARDLWGPAWEQVATQMIGSLRLQVARQPGHPRTAELVSRLSADSALFRDVWRRHEIGTCTPGIKRLYHPAGALDFISDEVMTASDQGLVFFVLIPLDPAGFAALLDRHARPKSA